MVLINLVFICPLRNNLLLHVAHGAITSSYLIYFSLGKRTKMQFQTSVIPDSVNRKKKIKLYNHTEYFENFCAFMFLHKPIENFVKPRALIYLYSDIIIYNLPHLLVIYSLSHV